MYDAGALAVLHDPVSIPILRAKARFFLEAYATAAERRAELDDVLEQDVVRLYPVGAADGEGLAQRAARAAQAVA